MGYHQVAPGDTFLEQHNPARTVSQKQFTAAQPWMMTPTDLSKKLACVIDGFNPGHAQPPTGSDLLVWELFHLGQAVWTVYERRCRLHRIVRPLLSRATWDEAQDAAKRGRQMLPTHVQEATILWLNIANAVDWAGAQDLEQTVAALNVYLGTLDQIVDRHRGTVSKVMDDGFLAIFACADDAAQAACALEKATADFNHKPSPTDGLTFSICIGIDTGQVALATLGSPERQDRVVIGRPVNVAREIQRQAPAGQVYLSHSTFYCLQDRSGYRAVRAIKIKGQQGSVFVYTRQAAAPTDIVETSLPDRDTLVEQVACNEDQIRKKLVRQLHDGPLQLVSSLVMRLYFCQQAWQRDPDSLPEQLTYMQELGNRAVCQMRTMLFDLRPVVLETQGLGPALRDLVEQQRKLSETTRLVLTVETCHPEGKVSRLGASIEAALFSIVQEAVHNAFKHARATRIVVRVQETPTELCVAVADDGIGFDVKQVMQHYADRGSLGLLNLEERAGQIGGKLTIGSTPGRGTSIAVQVPTTETEERRPPQVELQYAI